MRQCQRQQRPPTPESSFLSHGLAGHLSSQPQPWGFSALDCLSGFGVFHESETGERQTLLHKEHPPSWSWNFSHTKRAHRAIALKITALFPNCREAKDESTNRAMKNSAHSSQKLALWSVLHTDSLQGAPLEAPFQAHSKGGSVRPENSSPSSRHLRETLIKHQPCHHSPSSSKLLLTPHTSSQQRANQAQKQPALQGAGGGTDSPGDCEIWV